MVTELIILMCLAISLYLEYLEIQKTKERR